jgi:hypothetical protein
MNDRVFTGDTLLIRGTGRTDFQNGDARAQYDSIFNRLMKLPEETLVYPAHDYKGETVSTIGEEKVFNPRLQVKSIDEYVELMNNLNLPNPKMMDVAVPANMKVGFAQETIGKGRVTAKAIGLVGRPDIELIDLREKPERERSGLSRLLHAPYAELTTHVRPGVRCTSSRRRPASASGSLRLGERSAMAYRPRRTQASSPPATSTRHRCRKKAQGRWCGEHLCRQNMIPDVANMTPDVARRKRVNDA